MFRRAFRRAEVSWSGGGIAAFCLQAVPFERAAPGQRDDVKHAKRHMWPSRMPERGCQSADRPSNAESAIAP